jgi:CRP-like cAMP-binding protein
MTGETRNQLLICLEPTVSARFGSRLRQVALEQGRVLQRQGEVFEHVWFPQGALIALVSALPAGETVQTSIIGWDGALGVFEACGSRQSAFLAEVQVAGDAVCMAAEDYRQMFEASPALREQVHRYTEILLTEARQHVACNAVHSVEARLCRSLVEALERSADGRTLPMTQEALANALGVQRTTVTAAMMALQSSGAVRTGRGQIEILNPDRLEQGACCCRETLQIARRDIYRASEPVCES